MHLSDMTESEIEKAIKGLKLLRRVVKRDDIEHYQNEWGIHAARHEPKEDNYCGTMCCAAGKFALSKEGRKLGVEHEWERANIYDPIKRRNRKGWSLLIGGTQRMTEIADHIGRAINVPSDFLIYIFDITNSLRSMGQIGTKNVVGRIDFAIKQFRDELDLRK